MPTWQRVEHPDTPSGRGADWPTQASIRSKPRSRRRRVQTRCHSASKATHAQAMRSALQLAFFLRARIIGRKRPLMVFETKKEDNHQARGNHRADAERGHELFLHLAAHPTDQQIARQQTKTASDG